MKSFKDLNKKSFKKEKFLEIYDGFGLPLKSLSFEESNKTIDFGIEPEKKIRNFTKEEMENYKSKNPNVNYSAIKAFQVLELDLTDEKYLKKIEEVKTNFAAIKACTYVDLDKKVDNGLSLWEDLGLKSNEDYVGLSKKLFSKETEGGLNLGRTFLEKMNLIIKSLEDDPIIDKLLKVNELYQGKDSFSMLEDLEELPTLRKEIERAEQKNDILMDKIEILENRIEGLQKKVATDESEN